MFGNITLQMAAAIGCGLVAMGLVLWVGLRNRSVDTTQPKPADAAPPNVVSRIVSWTSMVARGGYRGQTKSLHRSGGSVDVLITDSAHADSPVKSWVLERSVSSMTLVAEEAFGAGTVAKVRPLNAPDDIPWIEINIHECSPQESEWRIVCRFVKVPPYNILMLFG